MIRRPSAWSRPTPAWFDHDSWTRRNSDMTDRECRRQGVCVVCGGRGGLWWSYLGEFGYTPCKACNQHI